MSVSRSRRPLAALAVLALVVGVLGVAGLSHAETGIVRIVIPGALAAPTGTSADGQVTLRIGVGLPVFEVNAAGTVIGGPIATATFAQWSDTVLTPDIGPQSTLMVFRLPDGLMVIAAGVGTPNGVATTFSATAPYENLSGQWEMATGSTPADVLITFAYDTNSHVKHKEFIQFVAGDALTSVATKTIPGVASVNALRNVPFFEVANHAKGASLGVLAGHSAHDIAGHASEVIELRTIRLRNANLYLLYGCAAPNPTSAIGCLVGGTGFSTHLSGPVGQIPGATAKATISGVADSDLVVEMEAENP